MKRFLVLVLPVLVAGCQPGACPELATYRDGLHSVDAALYAQHKTLIAEAVAKGYRTPLDAQLVDAEITRAEGQYQSSKNGPTTKP